MCWVVARFCGLVFVVVSLACVCCNDRQYRPDQRRVRAKIVWFDGLFGFGCFWVFGVGCWFWLCFVFVFVVLFGCVAFLLQGMNESDQSKRPPGIALGKFRSYVWGQRHFVSLCLVCLASAFASERTSLILPIYQRYNWLLCCVISCPSV